MSFCANSHFDERGSHSSLEEKERERTRAALDGVRENDTGREEEVGGGGDRAGGGAEEEVACIEAHVHTFVGFYKQTL